MQENILYYLSKIPDKRRKQGRRYPLDKMLCLVLLGTLSGRVGYRSISRFGKENEAYLSRIFGLKHGTPSHVSLTSIIEGVDFKDFQKAINEWGVARYSKVQSKGTSAKQVVALDGKAIKSSVKDGTSKSQNFIAFVNAFSINRECVLGALSYENGKTGEGVVLRELVEELGIKGAIFTMDARHDSKKR